jgi:predicted metal-dependent phosphoesterase TrpH
MRQRESWLRNASREEPSPGRRYADLHIHTTASDGCFSPKEVVSLAAKEGFAAISISDHDTVAGLPEGLAAAEEVGLEVIPGLELAADLDESEVHILGYCLDYESRPLAAELERLRKERLERTKKMVRLLSELGITLDETKIEQAAAFGCVGRMHLARALIEQGFVADIREAFGRYIGREQPAYVPRVHLSPAEACSLITEAGGIPVLAHPSKLDNDRLIPRLIQDGIMGIEAFYTRVAPELTAQYCRLAEEYGLLVTGGSDCHQSSDGRYLIGSIKLDYEYVRKLKEKAEERLAGRGRE